MTVTLYGFWRSLAAFRVRAALEYKNIPYTEKIINLFQGDQFSESYHALNPQHVIPLLNHDGKHISQSMAILEYLDAVWPQSSILPKDPYEQSYIRSISLISSADTHPLLIPRVRKYLNETYQADEATQTQWARHWLNIGTQAIEDRLMNEKLHGKFTLGDDISLADFVLTSHVVGARLFEADLSMAPTLVSIANHCLDLDCFKKSHPLQQPGSPGFK